MPLGEAIALAPAVAAPDPPGADGPLTAREREVAALVAAGRSHGEIAQRLVVTPRTVATHVEHILGTLGLTSRVQLSLWAAARGLGPPPAEP
jgi:non-specific serine/threonine protein kinase